MDASLSQGCCHRLRTTESTGKANFVDVQTRCLHIYNFQAAMPVYYSVHFVYNFETDEMCVRFAIPSGGSHREVHHRSRIDNRTLTVGLSRATQKALC